MRATMSSIRSWHPGQAVLSAGAALLIVMAIGWERARLQNEIDQLVTLLQSQQMLIVLGSPALNGGRHDAAQDSLLAQGPHFYDTAGQTNRLHRERDYLRWLVVLVLIVEGSVLWVWFGGRRPQRGPPTRAT